MMLVYPSVAAILAEEQLAGRLRIHPGVIVTAAEWRTGEAERAIIDAWDVIPFNSYQTSEGPIGIDCSLHRGIHVFEDLCIVEVVDSSNRPVPQGTRGDKILFTNLFGSTLPLIRYEISDLVERSPEPCPCGRPFPLIRAVEGRLEDVLHLDAVGGGTIAVHSNHFIEAMKGIPEVCRYRVVEEEDGIDIRVVARHDDMDLGVAASIIDRVRGSLEGRGAVCPPLRVRFVDEIRGDPSRLGKLKVVESLKA
jgi:phenylacetate-CoA ligase